MASEPSSPDSSATPARAAADAAPGEPSSVARAHGAAFVAAWRDVVSRVLRLPVEDG